MSEAVSAHSLRKNAKGLPIVLLMLFIGSGCAALIYEVIWFQLLQLVIGASAVSIGVLLGTFMGGMCVGSLFFSRMIAPSRHPLRVYAALEAAIGIIALLMLVGMPLFDRVYVALATPGANAVALRALMAAACLFPPTVLMGATLPAIARWVESSPRGIGWLGMFYGGNTAGAVMGALLAGFVLLRHLDMATATFVAVGINFLVAAVAWAVSLRAPRHLGETAIPADGAEAAAPLASWPVYTALAFSGAAALGAEVVWTRLLSLLLGGTVYTFSLILAVFLMGLGIGSSAGAAVARLLSKRAGGQHAARVALAFAQMGCAVGIAWTARALTVTLPGHPPSLADSTGALFREDFWRVTLAVLPATIFWGASFPLALAGLTRGRDAARTVGRLYAANTLGAIAGAAGFSLFLVPEAGTTMGHRVLVVLAGVAGIAAVLPTFLAALRKPAQAARPRLAVAGVVLFWAAAVPASALFVQQLMKWDQLPWKLVCFGRRIALDDPEKAGYFAQPLFVGEGINSTVAVVDLGGGHRQFHVSGKVEASSLPQDMRLQRMLGHFPALVHKNPESVLIVGCGAGVTAGSFIVHPSVKRIVICEIEPLIPQKIAPWFARENYSVANKTDGGKMVDPRVEIVYDDARHFILTTNEKFDIITSDPIHPWVKGAATLYTREYFELVKSRLKPGGMVTQWVPLYESSEETVKSEIGTFFKAFPNGTIWANDLEGEGYDTVLLGSNEPYTMDEEALQKRMDQSPLVGGSLSEVFFGSAFDLLKTYSGRAADLTAWTDSAQINEDRNLRLMYLAGASLNRFEGPMIQNNIHRHRKFPEGMMTLNEEKRRGLEASWGIEAVRRSSSR